MSATGTSTSRKRQRRMRFTKKSRSYLVGLLLGAVVLVLVVRSWDAQRLLDGIKMLR